MGIEIAREVSFVNLTWYSMALWDELWLPGMHRTNDHNRCRVSTGVIVNFCVRQVYDFGKVPIRSFADNTENSKRKEMDSAQTWSIKACCTHGNVGLYWPVPCAWLGLIRNDWELQRFLQTVDELIFEILWKYFSSKLDLILVSSLYPAPVACRKSWFVRLSFSFDWRRYMLF